MEFVQNPFTNQMLKKVFVFRTPKFFRKHKHSTATLTKIQAQKLS